MVGLRDCISYLDTCRSITFTSAECARVSSSRACFNELQAESLSRYTKYLDTVLNIASYGFPEQPHLICLKSRCQQVGNNRKVIHAHFPLASEASAHYSGVEYDVNNAHVSCFHWVRGRQNWRVSLVLTVLLCWLLISNDSQAILASRQNSFLFRFYLTIS